MQILVLILHHAFHYLLLNCETDFVEFTDMNQTQLTSIQQQNLSSTTSSLNDKNLISTQTLKNSALDDDDDDEDYDNNDEDEDDDDDDNFSPGSGRSALSFKAKTSTTTNLPTVPPTGKKIAFCDTNKRCESWKESCINGMCQCKFGYTRVGFKHYYPRQRFIICEIFECRFNSECIQQFGSHIYCSFLTRTCECNTGFRLDSYVYRCVSRNSITLYPTKPKHECTDNNDCFDKYPYKCNTDTNKCEEKFTEKNEDISYSKYPTYPTYTTTTSYGGRGMGKLLWAFIVIPFMALCRIMFN